MVDFMMTYFDRSRLECSRAIKFWRHTLMHTSEPRVLRNKNTGDDFSWLLHWGKDQMQRPGHFTVTGTSATQINMALFYLIEDLKCAQKKYLREMASDTTLQSNFHKAEKALYETDFRTF
jgi:hypothetical protein